MAKEPRAGRVKTRLAGEIGVVPAAAFYRTTATAVIARLASDRRWRTTLALAPDTAIASPVWPQCRSRIAQGAGDIGKRMLRALAAMPPGPAVLIGTDIPAIKPAHIASAFRALADHDVVFGPAADGGFWLVGLARRRPPGNIFANVRWSHAATLSDVLANLAPGCAALINCLHDIDDAPGHAAVVAWSGRRILPIRDQETVF